MRKIANVLILKTALLTLAFAGIAFAGVLENLDRELTALVDSTEPYLVTVEARFEQFDKVFVGSGILIDNDGYILTTISVVGDCPVADVSFNDGEKYTARVIGCDHNSGLALLKIEPVTRKTPVFGNSESMKQGSWVLVIGNSFEMPNAVSLGVYSGLTDEGFLQLSVQAGPGSSGSAVFNSSGQLIGLLVAQATETVSFKLPGDRAARISQASDYYTSVGLSLPAMGIDLPSAGINLAIPVSRMKMVTDQLKKYGKVRRGYLGIRQKPLKAGKLAELGIKGGVEVIEIVKDSPAEEAGLSKGDILIELAGTRIESPGHLYSLVRSYKPDDRIDLKIIRDGKKQEIAVTLDEAPDEGYFGFKEHPGQQFSDLYYNL